MLVYLILLAAYLLRSLTFFWPGLGAPLVVVVAVVAVVAVVIFGERQHSPFFFLNPTLPLRCPSPDKRLPLNMPFL